MSVSIESEGMDQVLEQLRGLGEDMMPTLRRGVKNGLQRVVAEAKLSAPVGETGQLRGSIGSNARINGETVVGDVHAKVEYAVYVEMGTGQRGYGSAIGAELGAMYTVSRGGKPYMGVPARPFLYPALKNNQAKIRDSIRKAVDRKVKGGADGNADEA